MTVLEKARCTRDDLTGEVDSADAFSRSVVLSGTDATSSWLRHVGKYASGTLATCALKDISEATLCFEERVMMNYLFGVGRELGTRAMLTTVPRNIII